ncbi:ACT domain-containing protein [Desulfosporosinus sp.]|uniref:ACT domain-containing protein n=1 Tax=Desulfosporosinus sp. TaxID=157907 RepID=UPI000E90C103|nr:ACT domain-containing protein [Desulfosporosinus sp.]MBC2721221.1 amino acid-binding protein [Desulfosporosinus sp.]MBC2728183.1 amino acid-binding protein [Desulfosporosinus sp.]HBV85859.1 amino acid-binding protein [Desulfosporosinus sp.]
MLQLSIFLENAKGRLAEVISLLADFKVNLRALSLADTKDYGVLRIIVDNPEETALKLRERRVVVSLTPVWVLKVPDRTGGLAEVLNQLVQQDVVVEYMYAFVEKENEQALVVLRVQDKAIMEKAMKTLNLPSK